MQSQLINAEVICTHYHTEVNFIHQLHDSGLVNLVAIDDTLFIHEDELHNLEKIVRMHYQLHINVEGIETIIHLLNKMESMQQQMTVLRTRLGLYEEV